MEEKSFNKTKKIIEGILLQILSPSYDFKITDLRIIEDNTEKHEFLFYLKQVIMIQKKPEGNNWFLKNDYQIELNSHLQNYLCKRKLFLKPEFIHINLTICSGERSAELFITINRNLQNTDLSLLVA
jgi:hypothetical protein